MKAFLLIVISIIFLYLLNSYAIAQEGEYDISLVGKEYEISRVTEVSGDKVVYYNISVTLHNSGTIESDDYTVEIQENDFKTMRNGTILPGEDVTFIWEEYPIFGLESRLINISYYPTDFAKRTESNIGHDSIVLMVDESDENDASPGFEVALVFIIISIFVLLANKKKLW